MLPTYSEEEKKQAEQIIYSYILKDYNICGNLGSAVGQEMPKDLKSSILYESSFEECDWGECDLTNMSGNGSKFLSCDFYTSKIHNAALQHSLFDNEVFYNCTFKGSNLAYSTFVWSIFKDCQIDGCAFTGTNFNHVTLQNCKISHSNFEMCRFQDVSFINTDFSNQALKYAFFNNVKMKYVLLPFMQLPYTFGGMQHTFSNKNHVQLATTNPNNPIISTREYRKMLPTLIVFFAGHNDYFPLANCYLANGQRDLAEQANEKGIVNSVLRCDFRKLYFFCLQATQEIQISKNKRCELYNKINKLFASNLLNRAEYHEFRHYFPMIKQLMFDNPCNSPTLLLSFHTNIAASDFKNLGLLMRTLDEVAENCGVKLDSKHMEIRHNSPNIVDWLPIGDVTQLFHLLHSTWETVYPVLSSSLQDIANVATLITALHGYYKLKKSKESKFKKKAIKTPLNFIESQIDDSNEPKKDDKLETLRLRVELLNQEKKWQELQKNNFLSNSDNSESIKKKLQKRREELINSGIHIDSLEVQLLGEQCDVLEHLYYTNLENI